MSNKGSSLLENKYVPMIGCFVAGFVVSRLMNHQDVVTGDVKEALPPFRGFKLAAWSFSMGLVWGLVAIFSLCLILGPKICPTRWD